MQRTSHSKRGIRWEGYQVGGASGGSGIRWEGHPVGGAVRHIH